jgi:hypothetical protein
MSVPISSATKVKLVAREHTESAIRVLAKIMNDEDLISSVRVTAANSLLDRGWGKPAQTISGDEENPLTLIQRIERVVVDPKQS